MKKLFLFAGLLFALAACNDKPSLMTCGGYEVDIAMSDDGDEITAVINGDEMVLTRAISASGVRYVGELNDTIVTLWNKGDDWTLYLNDDEMLECNR